MQRRILRPITGPLTELFDNPVDYLQESPTTFTFVVEWDDQEIEYEVEFDHLGEHEWDVEFRTWDVPGSSIGIVNFGDAAVTGQVFSTVMTIIKDFVDRNTVRALSFSAKAESRVSLYKAMVRRFARSMGWEMVARKTRRGATIFTVGEQDYLPEST